MFNVLIVLVNNAYSDQQENHVRDDTKSKLDMVIEVCKIRVLFASIMYKISNCCQKNNDKSNETIFSFLIIIKYFLGAAHIGNFKYLYQCLEPEDDEPTFKEFIETTSETNAEILHRLKDIKSYQCKIMNKNTEITQNIKRSGINQSENITITHK